MDVSIERMAQERLIGWATRALARWAKAKDAGPPAPSTGEAAWLECYGRRLSPNWQEQGVGSKLMPIFSLVRPERGDPLPISEVVARPLDLDTLLTKPAEDRAALWGGFRDERKKLTFQGAHYFESFSHLLRKYAWAVPCTYGEEGVSLYEEFKALCALVYASGGADEPADHFTLVGGDIPGIQDFVYTITSKGAAKALRGRSFFLQLLGDAVVRRLVLDLGLCWANVVYAAGGNFIVLAPPEGYVLGSGDTVARCLEQWQAEVNRALLAEHDGDLYLALAWTELPGDQVCGPGGEKGQGFYRPGFTDARGALAGLVAEAKTRRFAHLAQDDEGWTRVFGPQGRGGLDFCDVCQREPKEGEALIEDTTEGQVLVRKCPACQGFEQLARDIAHDDLWMIVGPAGEGTRDQGGWIGALARITGLAYRFEHDSERIGGWGTIYALNRTDFGAAGAHGYRFVANVTPRVSQADQQWLEARNREGEEPIPNVGQIKDVSLMALQAQGIAQVGILRMDVDNLGATFGPGLDASLPQVSALSAGLDLFFSGYLNRICRGVEKEGSHGETLYVIYAGGDDLFIVGPWDQMPGLGERIHLDFRAYTDQHPSFTISGGVTLEGSHFPIYRAAERAAEAEGQAKNYARVDGRRKNAFCLLGQAVGWEEWDQVRAAEGKLVELLAANVPRRLLQTCQILHYQFDQSRKRERQTRKRRAATSPEPTVYWGRWAWMAAYSLTRLAQGCRPEERQEILNIQREWVESGKRIHILGLAARWAEYRTRRSNT